MHILAGMDEHQEPKKIRPVEDFERALGEEISISIEYDLPLILLLVFRRDGWNPRATSRILDALRAVDIIAQPGPREIAVALPNSGPDAARAVERRLRRVLPDIAVGLTSRRDGDEAQDMLNRAHRAAMRSSRR